MSEKDGASTQHEEPHDDEQGGLIAWFTDNHVAANILMMLFVVGGLVTVANMRTETFPALDPKLVTVSVVYPGATPYEISDSITSRVEEALIGIEGVDRITATASEGIGVVYVELEDFANSDDVYNDVETSVNALVDFPPADAERPQIKKIKYTPKVMTIALHGEVSEHIIKYWAETIEEEIQQLDGVALTSISGLRDYQISVDIPESALREYDMSLQDVGAAVAAFSTDIPAGTVESKQGDILLRVQEKRYTGEEFENIVLKTLPDGSSLRIKDIGSVTDGFDETNLISRFNGERAAFIDISRSETEDTLAVAGAVKDYLETVELPRGLKLTLQQDQTDVLLDRIYLMMRNSILGFMLVFMILLLFLDLKLAFWTSVAIPVSFLGGLLIIGFLGYSINMISLFALIVVLGIVVDDAIVTGESIFEEQARNPNDHGAVLRGVKKVIAPVTIGVTTTMAAFAPLIFSTGTLGQIIQIIPIVVISILLVSLLEAYFILPSHLSHPGKWSRGIVSTARDKVTQGLENFVSNFFLPLATFCITWRYATLTLFCCLAMVTGAMFQSGTIRFVFFPQIEGDEVIVRATMPEGTPFEVTEETMLEIEKAASDVRDQITPDGKRVYKSMALTIGQTSSDAGPGSAGGSSSASNIGQLKLQLVSSDLREVSAAEIETMIRERIEHLPNIEKLELQSSLVGEEADIEVELTHPDEDILNKAADELKLRLEAIEGTKEVADTYEPGKVEYVFELTDEGLAVGLTPAELGQQLRAAFFGFEAQRIQRGSSEVIVYVRYPEEERESLGALEDMRFRLSDGREVPARSVATIREQRGYSQIQSVNGRRIVSVTGDVDYAVTTPSDVISVLRESVLPELQERYDGLSFSFEGESREQKEDLESLQGNMMIALMLIYVLLGAQLRSYIQPVIIMTAIPFGVVGAIWGHFLLGHDVTFISLFGMVALTGVVVNDSVVLVDYLNKHLDEGRSTVESCRRAIARRFRPIMLTTMTTSLGLLPMLLETSLQAQFLIPMVISLATGILFSTTVILILVPCLITIVQDIHNLFHKWIIKPAADAMPS